MGLLSLIVLGWQIQVLRGKAMKNADGTVDDWHEQKILYGMSVADIFLACPLCLIGIALIFLAPRWGFYLLAWISFWFFWANTMTTATSLRFEKPKITLNWLIVFPFGALVGLAYFVWTLAHFESIYLP
jgi:hypothetical protein